MLSSMVRRGGRQGRVHHAAGSRAPALIAAIASAALLGGCALSPEEDGGRRPDPSRFDNAAPAPPPAPMLARWWTQFGSPELTRIVERASAQNLDVAAPRPACSRPTRRRASPGPRCCRSRARHRLVAQPVERHDGGGRPPALARIARLRRPVRKLRGRCLGPQPRPPHRRRTHAGLRSLRREVVRLSTQGAVVNAWLQIAAARDRLAIAERNLGNARRVLAVLRERLAAGTGTALDIAQQESLVANLQAAVPPLRLTVETSRTALPSWSGRRRRASRPPPPPSARSGRRASPPACPRACCSAGRTCAMPSSRSPPPTRMSRPPARRCCRRSRSRPEAVTPAPDSRAC